MKSLKLLLLSLLLLSLVGCSKTPAPAPVKPAPTPKQAAEEAAPEKTGANVVLMMGRSVMGGWFRHWTGDSGARAKRGGYTLVPVEIDSPPEIAKSVERRLEEHKAEPAACVFFKFCFVDFVGGSKEEAAGNLTEKKRCVQDVYAAVVEKRDLPLIIGNALPKTRGETDEWLRWNHREFNSWLEDFASQHTEKVLLFDEYAPLVDEQGAIKPQYASGTGDAHPNDAGYEALDGPFDEILGEL